MGAQAVRLSNVDIDNALKNRDFEILFQPIFDLSNGALARVETFVRWRHATLGALPPGAFISFFESQGRMSELTRYVLNAALEQYKEWRGPYAPGFSINLALSDLGDEAFVSHFEVLLREHGFPADLITLECPMPPVDQDIEQAAQNFERLAKTGARLAIEVRGRTNDFLRKVDPFPFDEIKTGGAAILRFARTVRGPGLSAISELLDLANASNAAITAVGVEDQASLSALRSLGFAAAQGNHLGKVGGLKDFTPSRVNEVRALLDLEPLDKAALAAMFRTSAPSPQKSTSAAEPGANEKAPANAVTAAAEDAASSAKVAAFPRPQSNGASAERDDEALLKRLTARIARNEKHAAASASTGDATDDAPVQRAARGGNEEIENSEGDGDPSDEIDPALKAAAIARAKRRAETNPGPDEGAGQGAGPSEDVAARRLQARLTEEFPSRTRAGGGEASSLAVASDADAPAALDEDASSCPVNGPADKSPSSPAIEEEPGEKTDAAIDMADEKPDEAASHQSTEDAAFAAQDLDEHTDAGDVDEAEAEPEPQSADDQRTEEDAPKAVEAVDNAPAEADREADQSERAAPTAEAPETDDSDASIDATREENTTVASEDIEQSPETDAPAPPADTDRQADASVEPASAVASQSEREGSRADAGEDDRNAASADTMSPGEAGQTPTDGGDTHATSPVSNPEAPSTAFPATVAMTIPGPSARFIPMLFVGSPTETWHGDAGAPEFEPAPQYPEMPEVVIRDPASISTEEAAPRARSVGVADVIDPAAIADVARQEDPRPDDSAAEAGRDAEAADEPAEPETNTLRVGRRKRKNVLTRRYFRNVQFQWPTHFWPRSWKRAWRRRAAYRARMREENAAD